MTVLQVATTVRRKKLMTLKQDNDQTFIEFNARLWLLGVLTALSTPHACCASKSLVDYIPLVVRDMLIC